MTKEEIALLQAGDEIDFRTRDFRNGLPGIPGIETARIVGTTQESALIKSTKFPDLTIAVQAHNIVAARRLVAGDVTPIYTAIESRED